MYSWPANHPVDRTPSSHHKRNAKGKEKEYLSYPILDQGTLAAAVLSEEHGLFKWTSIIDKSHKDAKSGHIRPVKPTIVFPATRPPPLHMPPTNILQSAEQGAHFLRTYVPDVDVTAELIRDEIIEDANIMHQFEAFDPYVGNQLETIIHYDTPSKKSAFLAFPMGELSRDLNISPYVLSRKKGPVLKPSAQAIQTFDTPIQQISVSKPKTENRKQASYISVRTFGATSWPLHLDELGSFVSSDTGDRQVVDVKIAASPLDILLVNDRGSVYKCDIGAGIKLTRLVHRVVPPTQSTPYDMFWRLELTGTDNACLLMSKIDLKELDFRTEHSSSDLYLAIPNEVLTSVEDYKPDQMIRVCTTNQVIWIDRRNTAKPLLAFTHGRAFDRSLEAKTISVDNGHLTTLSSRKNGLLTIYDISRSQDSLPYVRTSPQWIQKGHSFFCHPMDVQESPINFLRLSEVGSIRAYPLAASDVGEISFSWSEDVQRLDSQSAQLREDPVGSLGSHDLAVVDMSPAYDFVFRAHRERSEIDAEEAAESLYDLVEKAPSYWQDRNDPVDHMLTTYDVLFRSGDEPSHSTRADFLTESVINSPRGYRALLQGRLSAETMKKGAQWHCDITSTLMKFDADISLDPRAVAEHLRRFDLKAGFQRSAQSLRRESEAREQLVLDLALSHHVFSPNPLSLDGDPNIELEIMTKTLSLDGEPPPVTFGYLHPLFNNAVDEGDDGKADMTGLKEEMTPLGVRLLLKDWDIGTDPTNFIYKDPYEGTPEEHVPIRKRRPSPHVESKQHLVVETQRPPLVVAATSIVPLNNLDPGRRFLSQDARAHLRPPLLSGSQPVATNTQVSGETQDFMASTQILPGAYGGRPAVKKKVAKKRLGGF
ncbi:hypothetical protein B0H10DRAFT_1994910 [Mycena sp. CBHHK59/15]|nr:hypothetical protein B0H10DRAFT_1994910 [Mycena sp. CBHHK59/15]